ADGKTASCNVKVGPAPVPVTDLVLDEEEIIGDIGEKKIITPTIEPSDATDKDLVWTSSNNTVATVAEIEDEKGELSLLKSGVVDISASTVDGGFTKTCKVYVRKEPTKAPTIKLANISKGKASLNLSWTNVNAGRYRVERSTGDTNNFVSLGETTGMTYVDSSALAKTRYNYRIVSVGEDEKCSSESQSTNVFTMLPPSNISLKLTSKNDVKITWSKVDGADGYKIYRKRSDEKDYKLIKSITNVKTVAYTNTDLKEGYRYRYQIRAYVGSNITEPLTAEDIKTKELFRWPVRGPHTPSSPYGPRGNELHMGIDIAKPTGTAILAVKSGTVTSVTSTGQRGKLVMLYHGKTLKGKKVESLYQHCNKIIVKKGEKVVKGQKIAEVGSTGKSTGPHLHFEIWISGDHKDPKLFLP
ncbi:MAG: peptidoglycan DD-metalloendopeptidase family protein, partial [Anaerovoracaceae bacterium]